MVDIYAHNPLYKFCQDEEDNGDTKYDDSDLERHYLIHIFFNSGELEE